MLLLKVGYVVSNSVVDSTDPLGINVEGGVNQEGAKETTEQMTNPGSLACV